MSREKKVRAGVDVLGVGTITELSIGDPADTIDTGGASETDLVIPVTGTPSSSFPSVDKATATVELVAIHDGSTLCESTKIEVCCVWDYDDVGGTIAVVRGLSYLPKIKRSYKLKTDSRFNTAFLSGDNITRLAVVQLPKSDCDWYVLEASQVVTQSMETFKTKDNSSYYDTIASKPQEISYKAVFPQEYIPSLRKKLLLNERIIDDGSTGNDVSTSRLVGDIMAGESIDGIFLIALPSRMLGKSISFTSIGADGLTDKTVQDHTESYMFWNAKPELDIEEEHSNDDQTNLELTFDCCDIQKIGYGWHMLTTLMHHMFPPL